MASVCHKIGVITSMQKFVRCAAVLSILQGDCQRFQRAQHAAPLREETGGGYLPVEKTLWKP